MCRRHLGAADRSADTRCNRLERYGGKNRSLNSLIALCAGFARSERFASTRNAILLLSDRLARLVGNAAILLLIARQLGPESFGVLSYAQSLIILATALATFGLPDILVREVIRRPRNADVIYAAAATIRTVGSVMGIALLAVVEIGLRGAGDRTALLTLILSMSLLFQTLEVFETKLQVDGRIALTAAIRTGTFILLAMLKIAVLILAPTLILIAVVICIEPLISGLVFFFLSRRRGSVFRGRARLLPAVRILLSHAVWVFVRVGLIAFYMRIDHIFIERMLGTTTLGHYSAAVRLVELWYFLPSAFMAAVAPQLARTFRESSAAYQTALKRLLAGLVCLSTVAALVMTVLAPLAISIAYGAEFAPSAAILAVYSWSIVFGTIGQISNNWLVNFRSLRVALAQAVIGASCALALYPLLIAAFGAIGAAAGFVVVQAITNVVTNGLFRTSRPLLWLQMSTFHPTHLASLAKALRPTASIKPDRPAC